MAKIENGEKLKMKSLHSFNIYKWKKLKEHLIL